MAFLLLTCSSVVCGCTLAACLCVLRIVLFVTFGVLWFCGLVTSLIVLIVACVCVVFVVFFVGYCGRLLLCLFGFVLVGWCYVVVGWGACCLASFCCCLWLCGYLVFGFAGWRYLVVCLTAASVQCGAC